MDIKFFIDDLKYRDLIKDCSDLEQLKNILEEGTVFYAGFDPTADSLHIGHFQQAILIKRFLLANPKNKAIVLCGGATASIGDPRQTSERNLLSLEEIGKNITALELQLKSLFKDVENVIFVNNYDWISKISSLSFLRDYGKFFNVNYMINKDIVASRLENGISFTEFSYTILQALDFLYLFEKYNCRLQIGGSDQWGNITSGLELIRKKHADKVVGFTSPLLIKSDGIKFGKSEGKNIWLDANRTSAYTMYQFLLNTSDNDVINLIKRLTFLNHDTIEQLEMSLKEKPFLREAHKALAKEIVTMIHGEQAYQDALAISQILFKGNLKDLSDLQFKSLISNYPVIEFENNDLFEVFKSTAIISSNRELREFINNKAININGEIIDENYNFENPMLNDYFLVRKGKKHYYLLKKI